MEISDKGTLKYGLLLGAVSVHVLILSIWSGFAITKAMGCFTLLDCKLVGQSVVAEGIKSLSLHLGTYPQSNASGLKRLAWLYGFAGQF